MREYSVGINCDDIIEADDELDAKAKFFESLSWKQCYASEIKPQESEEISERNMKMWEDIFKAEREPQERSNKE